MDLHKPAAKTRKLTDKNLPNALLQSPEFSADLLDMERRLDWTVTRKWVEVQDALNHTVPTSRTLRIFLSHTVSGQTWQQGADGLGAVGTTEGEAGKVNPETGEGIPAFPFRIEGRLLELPNPRAKDRPPPRKFSTLIKQMVVELE